MTSLQKLVTTFEAPTNLSLTLTIIWAIEHYFARISTSAIVISQYSKTKAGELQQNDIIDKLLKQTSENLNVKYLLRADSSYRKNDQYYFGAEEKIYSKRKAIWLLDSFESYLLLRKDLQDQRFHYKRNGYFCIVYTGSRVDLLKKLNQLFRRFLRLSVINLNFLVLNEKTTRVYSYSPFSEKKCSNSEPQLHGVLGPMTNYHFSKRDFFKRHGKMWGCPLSVTTWDEPPFTTLKNTEVSGAEGLLIRELAARKNFSINYTFVNNTEDGLIKLEKGETNISIGGALYHLHRLEKADAVYAYFYVPIVLAIPIGKTMTPWERLSRPFKYIIWSCLSSSVIVGILIIYVLKLCFKPYVHNFVFGNKFRTPFTNLWNILYGGSLHGPLPKRNFARYVLGVWILYTWVLRSAYIGELFFLLRDSRARSTLETIDEVVKQNFTFFTYPILKQFLKDALIPSGNIQNMDVNEQFSLLKSLENPNSKIAVTALAPFINVYNMQIENRLHPVNILPETLLSLPITFYVRKHSFLINELDELIIKMIDTGLINKFMDLHFGELVVSEEHEPTKLTVWLLSGIFSVYLILVFLCILMFILELWSKRTLLLKRIVDFLNY